MKLSFAVCDLDSVMAKLSFALSELDSVITKLSFAVSDLDSVIAKLSFAVSDLDLREPKLISERAIAPSQPETIGGSERSRWALPFV